MHIGCYSARCLILYTWIRVLGVENKLTATYFRVLRPLGFQAFFRSFSLCKSCHLFGLLPSDRLCIVEMMVRGGF